MLELAPNLYVQLISCTLACVGFGIWFNVKGKQIFYSGVGAFFAWLTYALVYDINQSNFIATFAGAIFVAFYADIMAKINKAPATIFMTVSVFPLIPGPNLYFVGYGIVMDNMELAKSELFILVETCVGIALGFILVEILLNEYKHLRNRFAPQKKTPTTTE